MSESAGRVLLIPKGAYDGSATYSALDVVSYGHNSYVAKQTTTGNLPTDTTYWQILTNVTADDSPTSGSTNLVESGGVYSELALKANIADLGTAAAKNSTNAVTESSTDLVESGAVYARTEPLWDNMMDNGAVNELENTKTSTVSTPVTWTVNADKTISATVASTTSSQMFFMLYENSAIPHLQNGKTYKITGCPTGGGFNSYRCFVYDKTVNAYAAQDLGDGAEFVFDSSHNYNVGAVIESGVTAQTVIFKLMFSDASLNLSYDDYVPYAMTNRELTTPVYFDLAVRNNRCTIDEQSNFRIGRQIYIRCKFTPIVSGTDLPVLTIPEGYRPKLLGSNDVGVTLNLVPKYNNPDRTNFMWALAFATGEVDCLTLSQGNAYLICGTYFLE